MILSRVLLIDAFNLIRRIYEARPGGDEKIGDVIDASARSVSRALRQHNPSHACVVFDSHDTTWRHLLYDGYKLGRKPTPVPLLDHLDGFESAFNDIGVRCLKLDNYEADDIIATLAVGVARNNSEVIILSTDKSFLQLLCSNIRVFNHFEQSEMTNAKVQQKYQVEVEQLTSYWALAGDASNNIKGVPGVGKKTAADLIHQYGSLENILNEKQASGPVARVQDNTGLLLRCRQLVTSKTNVELGINLKSLRLQP